MITKQTQLALSADCPQSIRQYFEKVRDLSKSGIQYPVKLDDVYPLVYAQKGKAVATLRRIFEEGLDYTSFSQMGKREIGGTVSINYSLSISCMEYFIARKIRAVFEVYREVFHRVADMAEQAVHVPQQNLINQIVRLEKKIDSMKRDHVKAFRARVVSRNQREYQKSVEVKKSERDNLFALFERYVKIHTFESGAAILDNILKQMVSAYNVDLRIQTRKTGEHYFDVAIRFGLGHCVAEVIKCHLFKSGDLK